MSREWVVLLIVVAAIWHPDPVAVTERDVIEDGYHDVLRGLYKHLYDELITNPPDDDASATQRFTKGLDTARKARRIALENLQ